MVNFVEITKRSYSHHISQSRMARSALLASAVDFLQNQERPVDDFVSLVLNSDCPPREITSLFWSLMTLSKSEGILGDNAMTRLREVSALIACENPELESLFLLVFDRADTVTFSNGNNFFRKFAIESLSSRRIHCSKQLDSNTEGWARLLLSLFHEGGSSQEFLQIIGEHMLDLDTAFDILISAVSIRDDLKLLDLLSLYPLNDVFARLLARSKQENGNGAYRALYFLCDSSPKKTWSVIGCSTKELSESYTAMIEASRRWCDELRKVRTILPNMTKEECYPEIYFQREKEYIEAEQELIQTEQFRLASVMRGNDALKIAKELCQFDCCLVDELADNVCETLMCELLADPESFLEKYEEYLSILACHCRKIELIDEICCMSLPPHVVANFVLQSVALHPSGHELGHRVFAVLARFSISERAQIYKHFTDGQLQISDSMTAVADTSREILYTFKRLSESNAASYTSKFAQWFVVAPNFAASELYRHICDTAPLSKIPFLITEGLSPLALDFLLVYFCEQIKSKRIIVGNPGRDVSDWPLDIAAFLGGLFADHAEVMDLFGYVEFVTKGLMSLKLGYLCLFRELITRMTAANYGGNLTSNEIEMRAGNQLLHWRRYLDFDDFERFAARREFLKKVLTDNDVALHILASLDAMTKTEEKSPDLVDKARFTFMTCCEFLQLSQSESLCPLELIKDFGFSLQAAFHIAKGTIKKAEELAPEKIPPELFGCFWTTSVGDFRIPERKFAEVDKELTHKLGEARDERESDGIKMIRDKLRAAAQEQRKKIQELRVKLSGKTWFSDKSVYSEFVRHCLIPRVLFSEMDSLFAAHFVHAIAHVSDFEYADLNEAVLDVLDIVICSATCEESRSIGLFLAKLLKFNADRTEEKRLHEGITEKLQLLLARTETFVISNAIIVMSLMTKYYPKTEEHQKVVDELLEKIDASASEGIKTSIEVYKGRLVANRNKKKSQKTQEREPPPKTVQFARQEPSRDDSPTSDGYRRYRLREYGRSQYEYQHASSYRPLSPYERLSENARASRLAYLQMEPGYRNHSPPRYPPPDFRRGPPGRYRD